MLNIIHTLATTALDSLHPTAQVAAIIGGAAVVVVFLWKTL